MRKLYIILAVILAFIGLILTILPLEKIGLIPVVLSLILSFLSLKKSEISQRKFPQFLIILSLIIVIVAIAKIFTDKDEVIVDKKDEIIKIESQKQDKKDLETLEDL